MAIPLIPLPYAYDALEPELCEEILRLHHDKHLKTYVDNLNGILEKHPEYQNYTLEELIIYNKTLPAEIQEPIWNNAGGVYNHNLYFDLMGKCGRKEPEGSLAGAITEYFGSFADFKKAFSQKAVSVFGSGYTWLVSDPAGRLSLINTKNQDTVLVYAVNPILLIDVWEHAYYLEYQNRRAEYIEKWFEIVCWEKVEQRYDIYLR